MSSSTVEFTVTLSRVSSFAEQFAAVVPETQFSDSQALLRHLEEMALALCY
jgi:hypothetical protein